MAISLDIDKKIGDFHLQVRYEGNARRIGILGASGCGKSMTLKSIAGIETPDAGQILVDGRTLYDSASKVNLKPQKRRVGYLFQNYALFPTMTVEQNIAAGLTGSRLSKQARVREMVEKFQLQGLEKRLPGQLSGGQQQRVALARCLAYEPEVLLLDEPFSAMDTFLKEGLRLELIKALDSYQGTTIIVTHDRDEAYQLCDDLILMDKGQVIRSGSCREVFEDPQTPKAARLTGCKNFSAIERIDAHHVRCLEWENLILTTAREVLPEHKYVGIRAYDFMPATEEEAAAGKAENVIPLGEAQISEMPFEWHITLQNGLWWKKHKSVHVHETIDQIPAYMKISPERVLPLH